MAIILYLSNVPECSKNRCNQDQNRENFNRINR